MILTLTRVSTLMQRTRNSPSYPLLVLQRLLIISPWCSLLSLPEIKREEILAERSEEKRRLQEKRLLAQMVKAQKGSGGMAGLDDDSVARAAKRESSCCAVKRCILTRCRATHCARRDEGEVAETR